MSLIKGGMYRRNVIWARGWSERVKQGRVYHNLPYSLYRFAEMDPSNFWRAATDTWHNTRNLKTVDNSVCRHVFVDKGHEQSLRTHCTSSRHLLWHTLKKMSPKYIPNSSWYSLSSEQTELSSKSIASWRPTFQKLSWKKNMRIADVHISNSKENDGLTQGTYI